MEYFIIIVLSIIILTRISFTLRGKKKRNATTKKYMEDILNLTDKGPEIMNHLSYISVSDDTLILFHLLKEYDIDNDLKSTLDKMIDISNCKMFDLGAGTNIELKNKYGKDNFKILLEYDTNYKTFLQLLYTAANDFIKYHKELDSIRLLELGIQYNTDLYKNYILLANLYKKTNNLTSLKELVDMIHSRKHLPQKRLLKEISQLT